MPKKIGKLEQKAIDIAKSQVIEAGQHKYCPNIYYYKPDAKFVLAMELDDKTSGFAICCINTLSTVQMGFAKRRWSLLDADQDLTRLALRCEEGHFEKRHSGWDIYDEVLADQGKPPQNQHKEENFKTPVRIKQELEKTKTPPPVAVSLDLQSIAAHMDYRIEILTNPSRASSRALVELGFLILITKRELQHGELTKWIEANTRVNKTWGAYSRRAAEQFIERNGEAPLLMLCNPSAESESGERVIAEQLLMEFTGGVGPSALLHNLGIKKRPAAEKTELPKGETREHLCAASTWSELGESLSRNGLSDETWAYLTKVERTNLYDLIHELDTRLKASLTNNQ